MVTIETLKRKIVSNVAQMHEMLVRRSVDGYIYPQQALESFFKKM